MRFIPLLAFLTLATPAFASNPTSSYVYPSMVDFMPDQLNATSVVIHGAFFFYTANFTYTAPACGKMYFACKNGEEAMCRMQWNEIANAINNGQFCEGFGQWSMAPTARLYAEKDPLGNPDVRDLGMGISQGVFVDGKCAPAMQLFCGGPPPDMANGSTDLASAPADIASAPPDLSTPASPPDLALGGAGRDLATAPDLSDTSKLTGGGCGCTVGGRAPLPAFALALALLAAVASLARRRARSR
jgi:MYXO-CTERM domain-containing protein